MNEVRRAKNVILFIDELHTLVGAGGAEGAIDASNVLKPALARGEIQCIGATTLDEYRKYIEKDAALRSPVPGDDGRAAQRRADTIEILEGSARPLRGAPPGADHRRGDCRPPSSCRSATSPAACLPDKAIDVIDEAGARVRLKSMTEAARIWRRSTTEIEQLNRREGRSRRQCRRL